MGRDKAELPAGDGMLVEHLAHRLRPVVDETIIAGGPASLELAGDGSTRRHACRLP